MTSCLTQFAAGTARVQNAQVLARLIRRGLVDNNADIPFDELPVFDEEKVCVCCVRRDCALHSVGHNAGLDC